MDLRLKLGPHPEEPALAGVSKDEMIEHVAHPSRRRLRRLLRMRERAGRLSGLLLGSGRVGDDAHDVAFLHDQQLLAVDLDFGARPLAEQHAVTDLDVDLDQLAGFVAATRADGGDFALRGLFLGTVRNDDAASCLLFGVDALDHNAVVKRTEFHAVLLSLWKCWRVLELAITASECQQDRTRDSPDLCWPQGLLPEKLALQHDACQFRPALLIFRTEPEVAY